MTNDADALATQKALSFRAQRGICRHTHGSGRFLAALGMTRIRTSTFGLPWSLVVHWEVIGHLSLADSVFPGCKNATIAPISGLRYTPSSSFGTLILTRTGMAPLARLAVGMRRST